ncbi:MAG: TVP38/TMEM64 family protein [Parachlamydiales bacterium]
MTESLQPKKKKKFAWIWRLIPLVVIAILMLLAWYFGLTKYLSFDALAANRQVLTSFVERHYIVAPLVFMGIYILSTSLSVPGGVWLTLAGGFLFGQPWSTIYVVVGATIGATIIFLIARTAVGAVLRAKAAPFLKKMEAGFKENQISYLFFLRLIPAFPFWLVNIAPAIFNVGLLTYVWTTALGILPGTFVYTQAGTGLGAILDSGQGFTLKGIFNLQIRIALIALAIFALIPVAVKQIRKWRKKQKS